MQKNIVKQFFDRFGNVHDYTQEHEDWWLAKVESETARAREEAAKVAIGMMYEETSHDSISFSTGEKISSTEKIIFNNACIQIAAAIRSQDDREGKKE